MSLPSPDGKYFPPSEFLLQSGMTDFQTSKRSLQKDQEDTPAFCCGQESIPPANPTTSNNKPALQKVPEQNPFANVTTEESVKAVMKKIKAFPATSNINNTPQQNRQCKEIVNEVMQKIKAFPSTSKKSCKSRDEINKSCNSNRNGEKFEARLVCLETDDERDEFIYSKYCAEGIVETYESNQNKIIMRDIKEKKVLPEAGFNVVIVPINKFELFETPDKNNCQCYNEENISTIRKKYINAKEDVENQESHKDISKTSFKNARKSSENAYDITTQTSNPKNKKHSGEIKYDIVTSTSHYDGGPENTKQSSKRISGSTYANKSNEHLTKNEGIRKTCSRINKLCIQKMASINIERQLVKQNVLQLQIENTNDGSDMNSRNVAYVECKYTAPEETVKRSFVDTGKNINIVGTSNVGCLSNKCLTTKNCLYNQSDFESNERKALQDMQNNVSSSNNKNQIKKQCYAHDIPIKENVQTSLRLGDMKNNVCTNDTCEWRQIYNKEHFYTNEDYPGMVKHNQAEIKYLDPVPEKEKSKRVSDKNALEKCVAKCVSIKIEEDVVPSKIHTLKEYVPAQEAKTMSFMNVYVDDDFISTAVKPKVVLDQPSLEASEISEPEVKKYLDFENNEDINYKNGGEVVKYDIVKNAKNTKIEEDNLSLSKKSLLRYRESVEVIEPYTNDITKSVTKVVKPINEKDVGGINKSSLKHDNSTQIVTPGRNEDKENETSKNSFLTYRDTMQVMKPSKFKDEIDKISLKLNNKARMNENSAQSVNRNINNESIRYAEDVALKYDNTVPFIYDNRKDIISLRTSNEYKSPEHKASPLSSSNKTSFAASTDGYPLDELFTIEDEDDNDHDAAMKKAVLIRVKEDDDSGAKIRNQYAEAFKPVHYAGSAESRRRNQTWEKHAMQSHVQVVKTIELQDNINNYNGFTGVEKNTESLGNHNYHVRMENPDLKKIELQNTLEEDIGVEKNNYSNGLLETKLTDTSAINLRFSSLENQQSTYIENKRISHSYNEKNDKKQGGQKNFGEILNSNIEIDGNEFNEYNEDKPNETICQCRWDGNIKIQSNNIEQQISSDPENPNNGRGGCKYKNKKPNVENNIMEVTNITDKPHQNSQLKCSKSCVEHSQYSTSCATNSQFLTTTLKPKCSKSSRTCPLKSKTAKIKPTPETHSKFSPVRSPKIKTPEKNSKISPHPISSNTKARSSPLKSSPTNPDIIKTPLPAEKSLKTCKTSPDFSKSSSTRTCLKIPDYSKMSLALKCCKINLARPQFSKINNQNDKLPSTVNANKTSSTLNQNNTLSKTCSKSTDKLNSESESKPNQLKNSTHDQLIQTPDNKSLHEQVILECGWTYDISRIVGKSIGTLDSVLNYEEIPSVRENYCKNKNDIVLRDAQNKPSVKQKKCCNEIKELLPVKRESVNVEDYIEVEDVSIQVSFSDDRDVCKCCVNKEALEKKLSKALGHKKCSANSETTDLVKPENLPMVTPENTSGFVAMLNDKSENTSFIRNESFVEDLNVTNQEIQVNTRISSVDEKNVIKKENKCTGCLNKSNVVVKEVINTCIDSIEAENVVTESQLLSPGEMLNTNNCSKIIDQELIYDNKANFTECSSTYKHDQQLESGSNKTYKNVCSKNENQADLIQNEKPTYQCQERNTQKVCGALEYEPHEEMDVSLVEKPKYDHKNSCRKNCLSPGNSKQRHIHCKEKMRCSNQKAEIKREGCKKQKHKDTKKMPLNDDSHITNMYTQLMNYEDCSCVKRGLNDNCKTVYYSKVYHYQNPGNMQSFLSSNHFLGPIDGSNAFHHSGDSLINEQLPKEATAGNKKDFTTTSANNPANSSFELNLRTVESNSEGETKCSCSVSSGELHYCATKDFLKNAHNGIGKGVKVVKKNLFNKNFVSYYYTRDSTSTNHH